MPFEPRYRNLVTLFNDSVSRYGPRPLFGTKKDGRWEWITYGDFGRLVDRCRAGLRQLGVGPGDRVAVISNNRVEWAVGAYATYGLGGVYVPMYEAQQPKEWKYILHDCGARVAFAATEEIARELEGLRGELPGLQHVLCFDAPAGRPDSLGALMERGAAAPCDPVAADPASLAGLLYTSGTTGQPKGVMLTHSNFACNVSAGLSVFPMVPDDRSLSFLPWAHSFGQTAELHLMICAGASMAICEGIPKIVDNLAEVSPTVLMAVPNIFNRIYDGVQKQMAAKPKPIQLLFRTAMEAQSRLRSGQPVSLGQQAAVLVARKLIFSKIVAKFGGKLRYALSGGAALSREVGEFVDNLGILVFEGYGLTETSPMASVNVPGARKLASAGKALPGCEVRLDFEASGSTEEGEVVVYGHNVMKGYYNLPDETARVFTADGGFRTGDLGRFDKDGFLFITGRIKELYKLENGKYIAPAALESRLHLSPYILQSMVYGANKPHNVALLVPKMDNLREWAKAAGLSVDDPHKLVQEPQVKALLRGELDTFGAEFKGYEQVRDFVVSAEEFSVANDLLTPKLSMKRRNVIKRYEAQLEALYQG